MIWGEAAVLILLVLVWITYIHRWLHVLFFRIRIEMYVMMYNKSFFVPFNYMSCNFWMSSNSDVYIFSLFHNVENVHRIFSNYIQFYLLNSWCRLHYHGQAAKEKCQQGPTVISNNMLGTQNFPTILDVIWPAVNL